MAIVIDSENTEKELMKSDIKALRKEINDLRKLLNDIAVTPNGGV